MRVLEKFKNIKWNKGVGEFLGFAVVIPFVTLMICAIFSAAQICIVSEQMLYASYSVARASVVCADEETGKDRATAVLETLYPSSSCSVSFVDDSKADTPTVTGHVNCSIKYVDSSMEWKKGSIIQCTISQYVTPLMPFTSGVRSQTIAMMVENGTGK